jgi:hypothetical protein
MTRLSQCLTAFILLNTYCANKPNTENSTVVDSAVVVGLEINPQWIDILQYQDSLNRLPIKMSASLYGQEIFQNYFEKSYSDQNDRAFKVYLEFQATLMDTLNRELARRPDFEKISSLIWADPTQHSQVGISYKKALNQNGLDFKSTEGMIYICRSTEPIRVCFYKHLSHATQEFFNQFEIEENNIYTEDGGLTITPKELADRLAFWDNFTAKYPNHLFNEFAQNNRKDYLYFLLDGMDNTPSFGFEIKIIEPNFLESYNYLTKNYPLLSSSKIVSEYIQLLKENNNTRNEAVASFISKYSIY